MVQGPNEVDILKPVLPPSTNATLNADAQRRQRQVGAAAADVTLKLAADTVHLSAKAVLASAQRVPVQAARELVAAPVPALNSVVVADLTRPVAAAPADLAYGVAAANLVPKQTPAVNTLAASWASSPAANALRNTPEVSPGRVAQAAQSLASIDGQGAGAVNAQIAEKLLTNF